MKNRLLQRILSALAVLLAVGLLAWGSQRSYDVAKNPALEEPPAIPEFTPDGQIKAPGMMSPAKATQAVSDRALVENATFSGVTRSDGELFFTYDPSKPRGKQACPT